MTEPELLELLSRTLKEYISIPHMPDEYYRLYAERVLFELKEAEVVAFE